MHNRRGEKNLQERSPQRYSLTAISAIHNTSPIHMLLAQNSSINAQRFNDYTMKSLDSEKDRKIIICLDYAPLHNHKDLEQMINGIDTKHSRQCTLFFRVKPH